MIHMTYTKHSKKRCQQRGINPLVVQFIIENGDHINTHADKKYFINKAKLKKLFFKNKEFVTKNDKHILNTAVIVNRNTVITAMKKTKKVRWN